MTSHVAEVRDAEADIRWRDWLARGAEGDRRRATIMGRLTILVAVGLAIWLFIELA